MGRLPWGDVVEPDLSMGCIGEEDGDADTGMMLVVLKAGFYIGRIVVHWFQGNASRWRSEGRTTKQPAFSHQSCPRGSGVC